MQYQIQVERQFSASHQLRLADGSLEPLHGHNWRVRVTVGAPVLDAIGTVMDFHDLQRRLDALVAPMHNAHLNDLPHFEQRNPSTEWVAVTIAEALTLPEPVRLLSVQVWETPDCAAIFHP